MATTGNPCKGLNGKGEPCGGYAVTGSDYCYIHDPSKAAERAQARRKGGRARHGRNLAPVEVKRVEITSVRDLILLLSDTVNDLLLLENSVARARAIISLTVAATRVLEVSELEQRIAALEAMAERSKNEAHW